MRVDNGFAAVEFVHDRRKGTVTEPLVIDAGQQPDTVSLQHIEGIFDFAQACLHIGQRKRGKHPEPAGMIRHQLRRELIERARQAASGGVVAIPHTRRRD